MTRQRTGEPPEPSTREYDEMIKDAEDDSRTGEGKAKPNDFQNWFESWERVIKGKGTKPKNVKEAISQINQEERDYLRRQIELDRRLNQVEQRIAKLEKSLA